MSKDPIVLEIEQILKDIFKKYNINHFGRCDVRDRLPCSCGRDEVLKRLKHWLDKIQSGQLA